MSPQQTPMTETPYYTLSSPSSPSRPLTGRFLLSPPGQLLPPSHSQAGSSSQPLAPSPSSRPSYSFPFSYPSCSPSLPPPLVPPSFPPPPPTSPSLSTSSSSTFIFVDSSRQPPTSFASSRPSPPLSPPLVPPSIPLPLPLPHPSPPPLVPPSFSSPTRHAKEGAGGAADEVVLPAPSPSSRPSYSPSFSFSSISTFISAALSSPSPPPLVPLSFPQLTGHAQEGAGGAVDELLVDAYLPERLLDKLMFIYKYMEMARATGVPISFLLSRGQSIKVLSQLLRKARQKNLVIPNVKQVGSEQGTFEGATCLISPLEDMERESRIYIRISPLLHVAWTRLISCILSSTRGAERNNQESPVDRERGIT
ncbi:hypothetical protein VNO80_26363 [Phaseolus coccineus]|uniref:DNA-directed DNA polymerase n=1 Tax=Phaseolus coccineus TaxID=3886 RepID=A0AAN9LIA3_PHACN